MIPGWLFALKPDANDLLVYATLARFGRFDTLAGVYEECRPALSTIAEQAGISVSSVKRGIGNLLRLGAVERQQRWAEDGKTQLPSVYRVIFGSIIGPQEQGGFTGEPRGESTGEPGGGSPVSQDPEPSTQNQDTQKPSASPRGTRLTKDWRPSEDLIEWARTNAPGVGWKEHEKFVDYWLAKPGKGGVKLDWDATWRNWMRRASERVVLANGSSSGQQNVTYTQRNDLYRIAKDQLKLQQSDMIEKLIEKGVPTAQAFKAGEAWLTEQITRLASSPVETNAGVPYIDGVVLQGNDPKEVTGS